MSVVKSKRKESQFEVFHHFTKMRKKITELLLRDFGYSYEKTEKCMSVRRIQISARQNTRRRGLVDKKGK